MLKKVVCAVSLLAIGFGAGYLTKSIMVKREDDSELEIEETDSGDADDDDDDEDDCYLEDSIENFKEVDFISNSSLFDTGVDDDDDEDEEEEDDEEEDDEVPVRVSRVFHDDDDDEDDEDDDEEEEDEDDDDDEEDELPEVDTRIYDDDDEETIALKKEIIGVREGINEREELLKTIAKDVAGDEFFRKEEKEEETQKEEEDEEDEKKDKRVPLLRPTDDGYEGLCKFLEHPDDIYDHEKAEEALGRFVAACARKEVHFEDGSPVSEEDRAHYEKYYEDDDDDFDNDYDDEDDDEYNEQHPRIYHIDEDDDEDDSEEEVKDKTEDNDTEEEVKDKTEDDDDEEEDEYNKQIRLGLSKSFESKLKDVDLEKLDDEDYVDDTFYGCACGKYKGKANLNKYCKVCRTKVKQLQMVFDISTGTLSQPKITTPIKIKLEEEKPPVEPVEFKLKIDEGEVKSDIVAVKEDDEVEQVKEELGDSIDEMMQKEGELIGTYYQPLVKKFNHAYQEKLGKMMTIMAQPDFDVDAFEDYCTRLESAIRYHQNNEKGLKFLGKIVSAFDSEYHLDERKKA